MTHESEITTAMPLCRSDGRLNEEAVGWARSAIVDTSGIGHGRLGYFRNKRWEYWGVAAGSHMLGLTISKLDYACLNTVYVLDRATGEEIETSAITPLGVGTELPGSFGAGPARAKAKGLAIAIDEVEGGTRLRARTKRVQFDILAHRPAGSECMAVVVPWNERQFQYTIKEVALPADGVLRVDRTRYRLRPGSAWAVLDHGRGRWPRELTWNWGAGSGIVAGRRIGVQIGGKWTDGTGSTENALFVDGRVHKIGEDLDWDYDTGDFMAPWRITGERAELTFTPFFDRVSRTDLGVVASFTNQCFGYYAGWMAADDGTRHRVDGAVGWAEHVHQKW